MLFPSHLWLILQHIPSVQLVVCHINNSLLKNNFSNDIGCILQYINVNEPLFTVIIRK